MKWLIRPFSAIQAWAWRSVQQVVHCLKTRPHKFWWGLVLAAVASLFGGLLPLAVSAAGSILFLWGLIGRRPRTSTKMLWARIGAYALVFAAVFIFRLAPWSWPPPTAISPTGCEAVPIALEEQYDFVWDYADGCLDWRGRPQTRVRFEVPTSGAYRFEGAAYPHTRSCFALFIYLPDLDEAVGADDVIELARGQHTAHIDCLVASNSLGFGLRITAERDG